MAGRTRFSIEVMTATSPVKCWRRCATRGNCARKLRNGAGGAAMKWLFVALLLLAASLILESGLLAFATYTLLGLLFVSRVLARRWSTQLEATRKLTHPT